MKTELKLHNGAPTVFFDGQPAFFGCHLVGYNDPATQKLNAPFIQRYKDAGVHIYSIDALTHEWVGPHAGSDSQYDYSLVIPRMQTYIDVDPDALFLMRVSFETRWLKDNWWSKLYPDEVELLSDGRRVGNSYASKIWQAQVSHFLADFIAYLKQVGLYDRTVAFQVDAGTSGEWIKDESSMQTETADYSKPMRLHFRHWLRGRYHNDTAALRAAWNDPRVTFGSARVPSHAEQAHTTTPHSFRDPRLEQKVIDYYDCLAELCADDMLGFCRTVREVTNGEKLIGGFFGYIMELAWNNCFFNGKSDLAHSEVSTIQRSGHLGLHKIMHSPDVDFVISPYGYAFRGLGGDGLPMSPSESLRAHGKMYFMEEDALMHNNFDPDGRNHRPQNSMAIYQRNFAQCLTHNEAVTWFETTDLHEAPELADERQAWIRRFQELGTWSLGLDRTPSAEVGVFLDDRSYNYESLQNHIDLSLIWRQRVLSLNRFGAPHDVYLLDDLLDGGADGKPLPPFKLYVFLNAFALGDARREKLKSILRRDGRTALWLYAPGLLNPDRLPPAGQDYDFCANLKDLTGMTFDVGACPWGQMMHVTDFDHPITRGLPQDWFWGSSSPIGPLFHLEDPQVRTLGEVVYSLGRCKPGFGIRTFNPGDPQAEWTSVYMASPEIPGPVLRGVARHAGVHLYSEDGDVLYATPELLSAHTVAGGARTFRLPHKVEVVYDLFHKKVLARDADVFADTLAPASTALYFTGKAAQLPE